MKAVYLLLLPGLAAASVSALCVNLDVQSVPEPNTSRICVDSKPGAHERYLLPAVPTLPNEISFSTDWAAIPTGGWGGEQAMDRCRIQADGFLTWHRKVAVRVEVQPNDDPLRLGANSERAEMLMMQSPDKILINENSKSGTQYYATSYYFPASWRGQQLPWSAFNSLDCTTNHANRCNSWSFVWQFYRWGGLSAAQTVLNGPQHYAFNGVPLPHGGSIATGKWTDFVFVVSWGSGDYVVWRRDEGEAKFTRALSGESPVPPGREIYVKQGLYRGGNVDGRTDVLWIGPTARGLSFSAVERQAFGTNDGWNDDPRHP